MALFYPRISDFQLSFGVSIDMISSMKKFLLIVVLATALIVGGGVYLFSRNTGEASKTPPTGYEYFYGNGCPHCANVDEFLKTWDGASKINLEKKEVWYNAQNANAMSLRAASCGIAKSELGVPFLVTPEGSCINGDTPIIDFLKGLNLNEKGS